MFRIKICGITGAGDAVTAAEAGADAVGINFYRRSPRCVTPKAAEAIADAVRGKALLVGVFVNEKPGLIRSLCRDLGIGAVQLSGDEPAANAEKIAIPRIRAVRLSPGQGLSDVADYPCEAFLVDAPVRGEYGGTGRTLDWRSIGEARVEEALPEDRKGYLRGRPWILAGGLTPENVAEAVRLTRPYGVDVASGVESSPGRKDPDLVRRFIQNTKEGPRN